MGQDINWDLRNYHFYIPFSFLHDRQGWDVAPGQVANFYNPLLYVPFYYLVSAVPPMIVGFVIGALQGLNGALLVEITRDMCERVKPQERRWVPWLMAVLALTGAGFVWELGTSFGDTVLSAIILLCLWVNLRVVGYWGAVLHRYAWAMVFWTGLLAGAVAGFKQPFAMYAVGLCGAFLVISGQWWRNVAIAFVFGVGVLLGMSATAGFWFAELWHRYGNPLFPYFNEVFQSPWAWLGPYRDERFLPKSALDAFLFPFTFITDPFHSGETPFRDARIATWYVVLFVFLGTMLVRLWRPVGRTVRAVPADLRYLTVFLALSLGAWLKLFSIYRYAVVLEMAALLAVWFMLRHLLGESFLRFRTVIALSLVAVAAVTQAGSWGRTSWGTSYFGVTLPKQGSLDDAVVLLTGYEPLSYVIPFFPESARFLRIQSWFTGPSPTPNLSDDLMQSVVREHKGAMYVLFRDTEGSMTVDALTAYGVRLDPERCEQFEPHVEQAIEETLFFCAVVRTDELGGQR